MSSVESTPFEELFALTNRLLVQAQALAGLAARLRLDELGAAGDPAVRTQLDRVTSALGVRDAVDALADHERAVALAFARSYLRQAVDLVEEPAREGTWSHDDPVLLQAQGSASAVVARLLADAGLGRDGARILDVGTGVGGLAIALCRAFEGSTVVGVDPWEPALALARENVSAAGVGDRVTLAAATIEEFDDDLGFDLVWLPSFFVHEANLDRALARVFALSRPAATAIVGVLYTPDDPLEAAVDDLFTVRSGGSALTADEATDRLRRAGFEDVREVERTWEAPLRLVAGRRR